MRFVELSLPGAFRVELEPIEDDRGSFARTFCAEEFAAKGLFDRIAQCNVSHNRKRGTLRGLHYQREPHAEAKLVSVTQGAIFDVLVDLRPESKTHHQWISVELASDRAEALYVPAGLAHGFLTLSDDAVVFYQMSTPYQPDAAAGLRWDDPALDITWPFAPEVISDRDREHLLL
ncbi:MAG: dTDP-4-dehydrorhamnose 3,5-epimerase [Myxococcota bacterium]